jgi:hypothetical protein
MRYHTTCGSLAEAPIINYTFLIICHLIKDPYSLNKCAYADHTTLMNGLIKWVVCSHNTIN